MPSLSMATSLIAFGLLKAYTALLTRLGWHHAQFTPQVCIAVCLFSISWWGWHPAPCANALHCIHSKACCRVGFAPPEPLKHRNVGALQ